MAAVAGAASPAAHTHVEEALRAVLRRNGVAALRSAVSARKRVARGRKKSKRKRTLPEGEGCQDETGLLSGTYLL